MRQTLSLIGLCVVLIAVTGCPLVSPQDVKFTNARSGQSSWWNPLTDATAGGTTDENGSPVPTTAPRDVVEPDVIRRVADQLFVLNQYRGLMIVDLTGKQIVSETATTGYPRDLYVIGNRAYVLVSGASNVTAQGNSVTWDIVSRLYVVDITDHAHPSILSHFDLQGDLVDSRLVGNVLYALCAEYDWTYGNGTVSVTKTKSSASWVSSINVADPANIFKADEESFEHLGDVIQATDTAIYVSGADTNASTSTITYVDISDPAGAITVRGAVAVEGYIADKYKLDAYQGVLRVVSASGFGSDRKVHVSTINLANPDALQILKSVQIDAASGESLFATRFDGPRAYIVTYLTQDPLFVVDLSDPANPVFAGQLVLPGWSTYIEPQGDRLIALGVDDSDGRKVSVSMFNVADPANPTLLARKTFGDSWAWSSAYSDVKAFTVLDNVLIVPFTGYGDVTGGYERLQFLSYDQNTLTLRGYVDVTGQVQRSFAYNNQYFGVTTEQLATIDGTDLNQPTVTNRLTFAEYTSDYLELAPDRFAQLVTQYDANKTIVRTRNETGEELGSVEVPGYANATAFVHGATVVLVASDWSVYPVDDVRTGVKDDSVAQYRVALVDCSIPASPSFVEIEVPIQPFWGYYWYDTPLMGAAESGSSDIAVGGVSPWRYWWPAATENLFLTGDTLVLRGQSATWDITLGTETVTQGLALVNLTTSAITTIGLGLDGITTLNVSDGNAYIGTQVNVGLGLVNPLCANYLRALDLTTHTLSSAANVPGTFLKYTPATGVLLVNDTQWGDTGSLGVSLRTVQWTPGGEATSLGKLALPAGTNRLLSRGDRVFYDEYNASGYNLHTALVAADGALSDGANVQVTSQSAYLLNASATTAYVPIENALLVYDMTGAGQLTGVYPIMGYPSAVRFGSAHSYAILGYSGMLVLP